MLSQGNLSGKYSSYKAHLTFTDNQCDQNYNYWMGRTVNPHNVGFKIDLGCSQRVRKIFLRNGYSVYCNRQDFFMILLSPSPFYTHDHLLHIIRSTKDYKILGAPADIDYLWETIIEDTFADAANRVACSKPLIQHELTIVVHVRFIHFIAVNFSGDGASLQYLAIE